MAADERACQLLMFRAVLRYIVDLVAILTVAQPAEDC